VRLVDTLPGVGGVGEIKKNEGVNSTMVYCKNLSITMYPKYNNNNKKMESSIL
jgi:hypothetical protein